MFYHRSGFEHPFNHGCICLFTQAPCSPEEKGDIPVKERERFSSEIKSWLLHALFLCFASFLHPNKFTLHGVSREVQKYLNPPPERKFN